MLLRDLQLRFYPESRFGGFSDGDGTVAFYSRIQALLRTNDRVLDVGCGRGAALREDPVLWRRFLRDLRGPGRKVIGIDVDPQASSNPGLDEFRLLDAAGERWPVEDASIDLIVADFVLEHIRSPQAWFSEVSRVLKSGGLYCARTSNRIGYVGLLARLIPDRQHVKFLNRAQRERRDMDVFPAYYQSNTVWALRRALREAGLDGIAYGYEAEPSYLAFAPWAYACGKLLHAITPPPLRTSLFVFARKSAAARA